MDVINISKYNLLAGSSYIKLPKELNHSKKGLIFNILMIMNALNGVQEDIYILQIMTQQELQTLKNQLEIN